MNEAPSSARHPVDQDGSRAINGPRPKWAPPVGLLAAAFGLMTITSGGGVLFFGNAARELAGDFVGFVVWFNFLAGFFYVIAGYGVFRWQRWAFPLSAAIAGLTVLAFAGFGIHVISGGSFEPRTVGAMFLRSGVWIGVAVACRKPMAA